VPDRYVVKLATAIASNTGGPYTATWDRAVVTSAGTIRTAWAVSPSIASNSFTNKVDIYNQTDAPSAGSNTATTILVDPIALINNRDAVEGTVTLKPGNISKYLGAPKILPEIPRRLGEYAHRQLERVR